MTAEENLDEQFDAYQRRVSQRKKKHSGKDLMSYAVTAGGLAFAGGDALGAIMHNTVAFSFTVTSSQTDFLVDIDGVGGADIGFALRGYVGTNVAVYNISNTPGGLTNAAVVGTNTGSGYALPLAASFMVGPTLATGSFGVFQYLLSPPGSNNFSATQYLGLRFNGDTGSIGIQYGWAKVKVESLGATTRLIFLETAFQDDGTAIAAGDTGGDAGGGNPASVPLPPSSLLMLLGLGSLGVREFRNRRDAGLKRLAEEA